MTPADIATWPRALPHDIEIPPTNICFNLLVSAERYAQRAVVIDEAGTLTYRELVARVEAIGAYLLHDVGVQRGDRALLYMQNSRAWVAAYFALLRIGAVIVPCNPMNKRGELPHYLTDTDAVVAFCDADNLGELLAVREAAQLRRVIVSGAHAVAEGAAEGAAEGDGLPAPALSVRRDWPRPRVDPAYPGTDGAGPTGANSRLEGEPPPEVGMCAGSDGAGFEAGAADAPQARQVVDMASVLARAGLGASVKAGPPYGAAGERLRLPPLQHHPDDLALILYSSGTTGAPKGCMHTHRTLTASTVIVAHWMGMVPQSVQLVALPFFHITGMQNLLNAPIYGGGTLVLMKRWQRDQAAELIARHRVSHWTAMPTMVIDFLASPRLADYDLRSIRRIGGGGAGMPEAVGLRLKSLTGLDFLEGYGLSETAHVSGNPASAFKRQCLGMPLFNTDLRIVDPDTLRELPPGEVGEIVMAGPQVFVGYWRNEAASKAASFEADGKRFVRSGDLGRRDDEGYFFIVDRLKRMVNASGFKVWPAEVEAMLHEHPAVEEACVIASRDPYRGETVKAVIVLREADRGSVTDTQIIDWAKQRMAAYKYPRLVEFVLELPKSATGKIAWRQLQEAELSKG